MSKKINKTNIRQGKGSSIEPTKLKSQGISFSLKYYQDNHKKFSFNHQKLAYFKTLFARLKSLSGLSRKELLANRSKSLRCHPIKWEDTSEDGFGLPNEEQLVDIPYQFSLSSNEGGRIHGFFIDEIFFIVWADPQHLLYDKSR